jgi:uncharacterized protein (TIGR04562 family)
MRDDYSSTGDFPWEIMDTMISGHSAIDVPRLYLSNLADADEFLRSYGFRWDDPEDRAELEGLRREALDFLENNLIEDEPGLELVPVVRDQEDIRKLLLWASAPIDGSRQLWSCTMLRLMHTFAHCGSYFQQMFSEQIREQVLGRFEAHVNEGPDGLRLGEGPDAIPLYSFQFRGTKSRSSLALKLLQKADNVAAEVFDWVGVRLVTEDRFDALLVAKYLRTHNIVVFPNVRAGRSRNTLIDTDSLRVEMKKIDEKVRAGKIAQHERMIQAREIARSLPYPTKGVRSANPFSLSTYHSIQFTVTQQVRVPNPYLGGVGRVIGNIDRLAHSSGNKVTAPIDKLAQSGASKLARTLQRAHLHSEVKFFFPYEVQILDKATFVESRSGRTSHAVYKARQRHAVKKRLFGNRIEKKTDQFSTVPHDLKRTAG